MSNVIKEGPEYFSDLPLLGNSFKLERLSFILNAIDICMPLLSVSQFSRDFCRQVSEHANLARTPPIMHALINSMQLKWWRFTEK